MNTYIISGNTVNQKAMRGLVRWFLDIQSKDNLRKFRFYKRGLERVEDPIIIVICMDEDTDRPIGYGHLDWDPNPMQLWLGICVSQGYTNLGVGHTIIQSLCFELDYHLRNLTALLSNHKKYDDYPLVSPWKVMCLSVDVDNDPAITFYEKLGFEPERTHYSISGDCHAIFMKKKLTGMPDQWFSKLSAVKNTQEAEE